MRLLKTKLMTSCLKWAFLSFKGEIPSWNPTSPEFYYDLFRRKIANQMCVVELEVHIGRYPDVCA